MGYSGHKTDIAVFLLIFYLFLLYTQTAWSPDTENVSGLVWKGIELSNLVGSIVFGIFGDGIKLVGAYIFDVSFGFLESLYAVDLAASIWVASRSSLATRHMLLKSV